MATAVQQPSTSSTSAVDRLTDLARASERFDIAHEDILPLQLEAANELLEDRIGRIKLLRNRAETAGITSIGKAADLVPLLFAHTAYKSYPESWLTEKRWDRLGKWLETVSTNRVEGVDLDGIRDIDDWLGRLEAVGHFVSCSSGTSGKSAMLNSTAADLEWTADDSVLATCWGTGVEPAGDRRVFGLAPVASVPRNLAIRGRLQQAFGDPSDPGFVYPVPPITIGGLTQMVALRKMIADGTAKPGDLADYERISAERQKSVDDAVGISAQALVDARHSKLFMSGMWAALYKIAEAVRGMGYSGKDFHPENMIYIGGGLKGASLPPDFKEYVCETFNLAPERAFQMYGMQEMNSAMPRCRAGRYHAPPWMMVLLLDQGGDNLIEPTPGVEQEGRAAFFDVSLKGRWNGVISGDKIMIDYGHCECGNRSPSVRDNITRFADLPGGDKISCSGTIDAYVRGVA
jgi:hypothetical protein